MGSAVERAAEAVGASVEDVGLDHRRGDVLVAEQLLDCSDVVAALEAVRGEAVSQVWGVTSFVMSASIAAARVGRWMTVSCKW
jgi:hypothetical protein